MCVHTHTHTHTRLLLSYKKEWNFVICSNMNSLVGYYDEWYKSNSVGDINTTYMWKSKKYNKLVNIQKEADSDTENKPVKGGKRDGQ